MKLSEWIVDYAEDNSIELPDDIPDEITALEFLGLNGSGGGGGGDFGSADVSVTISGETEDETTLISNAFLIFDDEIRILSEPCLNTIGQIGTTTQIGTILYKGKSYIYDPNGNITQTSGNINQAYLDYYGSTVNGYIIEGTCSITCKSSINN